MTETVVYSSVSVENDDEIQSNEGSVILAKIIAMVVLFFASLICGLLPLKFAHHFKWTAESHANKENKATYILSIFLCFGGGILMCTTFQHLLPEINENIELLLETGQLPDLFFSLGEFLMCTGFFTIYLVEELVHVYLQHHEHRITERNNSVGDAFIRGMSIRESTVMKKHSITSRRDSVTTDLPTVIDHGHHHHPGHHHIPSQTTSEVTLVSSVRGLLIVLALSVHELFEGLAVGLENSPSNVWYMFAAVSAHKLVIAFCVGVELIVAKTKLWLAVVYVLIFAVVSPIGIGIGILLSHTGNTNDVTVISVILQGLAAGTLLYVIFFEVLAKERSGLIRYSAILLGFLFMFGLLFIIHATTPHSHREKEDHTEKSSW